MTRKEANHATIVLPEPTSPDEPLHRLCGAHILINLA
jgi:hypothetical protein